MTPITLQASKCLTVYLRQLSILSQVQPVCLCQKKQNKKNHYTSQCCETWKPVVGRAQNITILKIWLHLQVPKSSFLNLTIQNYPQFKHNTVFYRLWNGLNCEVPSQKKSDFSHTQCSCACHRVQPCEFMQRVINFYHFIGLKKFRCTRQSPFIIIIINLTEQLDGRDSVAQKWEEVQDNILVQEWHFKPLLSIGLDILSLETDVLMMKTSHQNCFEP